MPEAREFSDGYIAIVEHLHWRRVAVVYYSDDFTLNVSIYKQGVVIVYGMGTMEKFKSIFLSR